MLDINMIFKIAGVGVVLLILDKILESNGKKDIATLANLAGVVLILLMVLSIIVKLFDSVRTMFQF